MSSLFMDADRAMWIGVAMLVAGILFLVMFKHGFAVRRQRRAQGDSRARKGFIIGLLQFVSILLIMASSLLIIFSGMLLRSYRSFSDRELVARLHAVRISLSPPRMQVTFLNGGAPELDNRQFEMDGDQWALEGNVLKWADWLGVLGLQANYKLTRLRSRYLDANDEREKPASVHVLSDETAGGAWQWLFRRGESLPFVQAVYGNSVYAFPETEKVFHVYVAASGFMIEPASPREISARP